MASGSGSGKMPSSPRAVNQQSSTLTRLELLENPVRVWGCLHRAYIRLCDIIGAYNHYRIAYPEGMLDVLENLRALERRFVEAVISLHQHPDSTFAAVFANSFAENESQAITSLMNQSLPEISQVGQLYPSYRHYLVVISRILGRFEVELRIECRRLAYVPSEVPTAAPFLLPFTVDQLLLSISNHNRNPTSECLWNIPVFFTSRRSQLRNRLEHQTHLDTGRYSPTEVRDGRQERDKLEGELRVVDSAEQMLRVVGACTGHPLLDTSVLRGVEQNNDQDGWLLLREHSVAILRLFVVPFAGDVFPSTSRSSENEERKTWNDFERNVQEMPYSDGRCLNSQGGRGGSSFVPTMGRNSYHQNRHVPGRIMDTRPASVNLDPPFYSREREIDNVESNRPSAFRRHWRPQPLEPDNVGNSASHNRFNSNLFFNRVESELGTSVTVEDRNTYHGYGNELSDLLLRNHVTDFTPLPDRDHSSARLGTPSFHEEIGSRRHESILNGPIEERFDRDNSRFHRALGELSRIVEQLIEQNLRSERALIEQRNGLRSVNESVHKLRVELNQMREDRLLTDWPQSFNNRRDGLDFNRLTRSATDDIYRNLEVIPQSRQNVNRRSDMNIRFSRLSSDSNRLDSQMVENNELAGVNSRFTSISRPNAYGSTSNLHDDFDVHSGAANNLMLNNQVPPGNRANNYWDNFKSYSRQNLLSNSKTNIPVSSPSGLDERTVGATALTDDRGNSGSPGYHRRDSRGERSSMKSFLSGNFVENISLKKRNKDQKSQPLGQSSSPHRSSSSNSSAGSLSLNELPMLIPNNRTESTEAGLLEFGATRDFVAESLELAASVDALRDARESTIDQTLDEVNAAFAATAISSPSPPLQADLVSRDEFMQMNGGSSGSKDSGSSTSSRKELKQFIPETSLMTEGASNDVEWRWNYEGLKSPKPENQEDQGVRMERTWFERDWSLELDPEAVEDDSRKKAPDSTSEKEPRT